MKIDFEDLGSNGGFLPRKPEMAWDLRIRWVLKPGGPEQLPLGVWKCRSNKADECWTLKDGSIPDVAGWLFQEVRTETARVYPNGIISWDERPVDHYWEMWAVRRSQDRYLAFPALKPPNAWVHADADAFAPEAFNDAFVVGNGDLATLAESERKLPQGKRAYCFIYQKRGDVYFCPWNDANVDRVDAWYSAAKINPGGPAGRLPASEKGPDLAGADDEGYLCRTHLIYVTGGGAAQRTMPRYINAAIV